MTFEDAFLDLYEDDELRIQELGYPTRLITDSGG